LNHDASLIYTNQNNFLGFQIADVKTGKVLWELEIGGRCYSSPVGDAEPHGRRRLESVAQRLE
jgi:hypothetical protein